MQPPSGAGKGVRFPSAAHLQAFGARLAPCLEVGEALCLFGPLGAGKTTFARGLIGAFCGRPTEAPSPTFTLVQAYEGPAFPLAHFDLYRLRDAAEAYEIGLEEALDVGAAAIEWSERLGPALPVDRLDLRLAARVEGGLELRWGWFEGHGRWAGKARALDL